MAGIPGRRPARAARLEPITADQLLELYVQQDVSARQVAERLGGEETRVTLRLPGTLTGCCTVCSRWVSQGDGCRPAASLPDDTAVINGNDRAFDERAEASAHARPGPSAGRHRNINYLRG